MKKLIVNADDFGLHKEVNCAVIEGYNQGIIRSASIIAAGRAFDDAVALAKQHPRLGIGIHLTLAGGEKPVLGKSVPSLLDRSGKLYSSYLPFAKAYYGGKIRREEIMTELSAQIEKVAAAGLSISHIDSHQHLHVLPGISNMVVKLAKRFNIKKIRTPLEPMGYFSCGKNNISRIIARDALSVCSYLCSWQARRAGFVSPEHFYGMLDGGKMTVKRFLSLIAQLPDGTSEIMVHPGRSDRMLNAVYGWGYAWQSELAAVTDVNVRKFIDNNGILLVNYHEV